MLMPFIGNIIMPTMLPYSLEIGALVSLTLFMVPPLICMGMVSPVNINLLTHNFESAGNSAGNVYAISTVGGIVATFLMGFVIIPNFGLTWPAIFFGIILISLPIYKVLQSKLKLGLGAIVLALCTSFLSFSNTQEYYDEYKVLYQSEGIFGQVKVVDHPAYDISVDGREGRGLIVNNTLQTLVDINDIEMQSLWSWANYFPTAASVYPEGSKVLLLGLGGGTLVKQLNDLGFEVDAVEINKRIWEVSNKYFGLNPNILNIIIDDARHYIKKCNKKYDIIIFDTFLSESVPEHLLTTEGLTDTKAIFKREWYDYDKLLRINRRSPWCSC